MSGRRGSKPIVVLLLTAALVAAALVLPATGGVGRFLGPDDLLQIEEIGEVAISPDGKWLAYVLKRSKAAAVRDGQSFDQVRLQGNDRADIWLVATEGGEPRNLTNGAADRCGYWCPTWSPDSQKLAMVSTKGGNVRAWVWEVGTELPRELDRRGLDLQFGQSPLVWVDGDRLAFAVLPDGDRPFFADLDVRAAKRAMDVWPRSLLGREATVSAIHSGVPPRYEDRPQGTLLIAELGGQVREIARGSGFRDLVLSPDGRSLAFLKRVGNVVPDPGRPIQHGRPQLYGIHQAWIASVRSDRPPRSLPAEEAFPGSLQWAPDSEELVVVGQPDARSPSWGILRCRAMDGRCSSTGGELAALSTPTRPASFAWSASNDLLVLSSESVAPGARTERGRVDWWAVPRQGPARRLTASMKSVPGRLLRERGGQSFVGVGDGQVWRLAAEGSPRSLTDSSLGTVDSIVWPPPPQGSIAATDLIVAVKKGDGTDLQRLALDSGATEPFGTPATGSVLADYSPEGRVAALTMNDGSGTRLWLSRPALDEHVPVVATNVFLSGILPGKTRKVEYTSVDGEPLGAWLLLPPGYEEGRRYPLVAWVYAGFIAGQQPPGLTQVFNPSPLNLQLLAARGFAVLIPSMPLAPDTRPSDPYGELTKGVIPAIDKVIELGIADGERLGVMGQSYGGYSTYGLVTQSNRFKAAVSLAGISDLLSMYGQLDPRVRYDDYPHELLVMMSIAETGQLRMGNPPWKDLWRYVRNSPLFYVERVTTPLMIVQGDLDFVPMEQAEMFFTALQRQGKRASLVRYWGEGHVLEAPANIRDMWERIYGWFDEFLKPRPDAPHP